MTTKAIRSSEIISPIRSLASYRGMGLVLETDSRYYRGVDKWGIFIRENGRLKVFDAAIYGATWIQLPSKLWVLKFDGIDDYMDCGNDPILNPLDAIAIKAWIMPEVTGVELRILGDMDSYWLNIDSVGRLCFYVGTVDANGITMSNALTWIANRWYHILVTHNNAIRTTSFYRDGVFINSNTAAIGGLRVNTGKFSVGNWITWATINTFKGLIGKVCVYNQVLSANEVTSDFEEERRLYGV